MEFCPRCGSVLIEKRKNFGCARCGYTAKGKVKIEASEKIREKERIGVVREKEKRNLEFFYPYCVISCSYA